MIKITVSLLFPLGAKFNRNPKLVIYKQFLKMVQKLSCFNVEGKCDSCPMHDSCMYYRISGENLKMYPGIFIQSQIFEKSFFCQGEELVLDFLVLGNQQNNISYIELFFQQYCKQSICKIPFYIRSIQKDCVDGIRDLSASVISIVENEKVQVVVDDMVNYYNEKYETNYASVIVNTKDSMVRNIQMQDLKNHKIYGNVGMQVEMCNFPEELILCGIGKYNYLGGGILAIKD